jgi:hypothetical protein
MSDLQLWQESSEGRADRIKREFGYLGFEAFTEMRKELLDSGKHHRTVMRLLQPLFGVGGCWQRGMKLGDTDYVDEPPEVAVSVSESALDNDPAPAMRPTQDDLAFVYQNYGRFKLLEQGQAPSVGAYTLLEMAESNEKVYLWVLDRLSPKTYEDDEPGGCLAMAKRLGLSDEIRSRFGRFREEALGLGDDDGS